MKTSESIVELFSFFFDDGSGGVGGDGFERVSYYANFHWGTLVYDVATVGRRFR